MEEQYEILIRKAYSGFNARDIEAVLSTFHPDVEWPKAFEGGYVTGHDAVRDYWTRQWKEIDPVVKPLNVQQRQDGTVLVTVRQIVKNMMGTVAFDGIVHHVYSLEGGLLRRMDIEPA